MRTTAFVLLIIMVAASLFSFGFVNDMHSGIAQIIFGVSLVLFVLTTLAGFTPSVQVRPAKRSVTPGRAAAGLPTGLGKFALLYVTVGALGVIWCGIWYWYLNNHPPQSDLTWYWCYGAFLTSLGMLAIGLGMGRILRAARYADELPENSLPTTAEPQAVSKPAPVNPPVNKLAQPPTAPSVPIR